LGVVASDVILLEVRQEDFVYDGPHGMAQLVPLLQRVLRLYHLKPQKKKLMLVLTEVDSTEGSTDEHAAFAAAALDRAWDSVVKPEGLATASLTDLLLLEVTALPPAAHAPEEHAQALAALTARFRSSESSQFVFEDGSWSCSAATSISCLELLAKQQAPAAATTPAPSAEVLSTYACSSVADTCIKSFNKMLAQLKKEAEPAFLADFGERASAMVDETLASYDEATTSYCEVTSMGTVRKSLHQQMLRAMYPAYRKQLAHLQRQVLAKFRQKKGVFTAKPTVKIESDLRALVKDSVGEFKKQAQQLLSPWAGWSFRHEQSMVLSTLEEDVKAHIENMRVQGLYIPASGGRMPVDLSVHWLSLAPFGADERSDAIRPKRDKAKFRPRTTPMKVRATDGYKIRARDPKEMVFTDKALQ